MTDHKIVPAPDIKSSSVLTLVNPERKMFHEKPELLPCVFYGYTMSLVRSSASRIYLATVGQQRSAQLKELVDGLPPLLGARVKLVDSDQRIFTALKAIMDPIYAEAEYLWDKEFPDENNAPEPKHEHTVCLLYELMHLLILGQTYRAEVDFDPVLAQHCVKRLRKRLTSSEGCAALARIEGITHAYSKTSEVSSLVPFTDSEELRTGTLLRDLLEDARWVDATFARREVGVLGKLSSALSIMKRKLTEILRDPSKQKYLSLGRQLVTTAAEKAPIPLPIPSVGSSAHVNFSPPMQCLKGIKPHCIGTTHWFPFSPSEVDTDLYMQPEKNLCPVGFLFLKKDKNQDRAPGKESSNKPDTGDGK